MITADISTECFKDFLTELLTELSQQRPIFHSEADFQFSLAWKIKEHLKDGDEVRLEHPFPKTEGERKRNQYIDIVVLLNGKKIPIEVKYKTTCLGNQSSTCAVKIGDEEFTLKNQSAHDVGMYDSLHDIERIEELQSKHSERGFTEGYTIWLTNDSVYWRDTHKDANHDEFRIYDGITIPTDKSQGSNLLQWKAGTSKGAKAGREAPIKLIGSYQIKWFDYSNLADIYDTAESNNTKFKYAITSIK